MEGGGNGLDGRGVVAVPPWKGRIPNRRSLFDFAQGYAQGPLTRMGHARFLKSGRPGRFGWAPAYSFSSGALPGRASHCAPTMSTNPSENTTLPTIERAESPVFTYLFRLIPSL